MAATKRGRRGGRVPRGGLSPRPLSACPYCGDPDCYQQCVSAREDRDEVRSTHHYDEGGEA